MRGLIAIMKRPVVIAMIVCVSCFLVTAITFVTQKDCGMDSECSLDHNYTFTGLAFFLLGSAIAIFLCLYGISAVALFLTKGPSKE
jgi:hypothetical protein